MDVRQRRYVAEYSDMSWKVGLNEYRAEMAIAKRKVEGLGEGRIKSVNHGARQEVSEEQEQGTRTRTLTKRREGGKWRMSKLIEEKSMKNELRIKVAGSIPSRGSVILVRYIALLCTCDWGMWSQLTSSRGVFSHPVWPGTSPTRSIFSTFFFLLLTITGRGASVPPKCCMLSLRNYQVGYRTCLPPTQDRTVFGHVRACCAVFTPSEI